MIIMSNEGEGQRWAIIIALFCFSILVTASGVYRIGYESGYTSGHIIGYWGGTVDGMESCRILVTCKLEGGFDCLDKALEVLNDFPDP